MAEILDLTESGWDDGERVPITHPEESTADIENFIFSLSKVESQVLTLMNMGFKPREVVKIMGFNHRSDYYRIVSRIKEHLKKAQNGISLV